MGILDPKGPLLDPEGRVERISDKAAGTIFVKSSVSLMLALISSLVLLALPALASDGAKLSGPGSRSDNLTEIQPIGELQPARYARTVDGNTIVVEIGDSDEPIVVRLFAVNQPKLEQGIPQAFQAALDLSLLLGGGSDGLWIETDDVMYEDQYGHTLAWVWFSPTGSGGRRVQLQEHMLRYFGAEYNPQVQSLRYPELAMVETFEQAPKPRRIGKPGGKPNVVRNDPPPASVSTGGLDIADHGLKWLKTEYGWSDFSWRVDVVNNTGGKVFLNLKLELMDGDGFVLDTEYIWRALSDTGKQSFSDTGSIEAELARLVESYQVSVEETI